jgi:hypothetical protein
MSIADRIADAKLLWDNEHHEGAFLCVLVATAATARKRFPGDTDKTAFIKFVENSTKVRMGLEYKGELQSIEFIFYKFMRCQLVHEGELPPDIKFSQEMEPGQMSARAGGAPEYILKIGKGWYFHLVHAVKTAPENDGQFK